MPIAYSQSTCAPPDTAPSSTFDSLNLAVFIIPVITIPICWIIWAYLRRLPRLKIRSLPANVLCGVAVIVHGIECGLRRTSIALGWPCWVQPLLVLSMVGLLATAGLVRVFAAHSLKMRSHLKTTIGEIQFSEEQPASPLESTQQKLTRSMSLLKMWPVMSNDSPLFYLQNRRILADVLHLVFFGNVRGDPARLLQALVGATKPINLFFIAIIAYVPVLIVLVVLCTLTPVYQLGCTSGCATFPMELYISLWVVILVSLAFILVPFLRLLGDEDTTGVLFEIKFSAIYTAPFFVVGLVTIPLDPSDLNENGILNWEWFLFIYAYSIWFIWTPVQIGLAIYYRALSRQGAPPSAGELEFANGMVLEKFLLDDEVYADFLKFCELNLQPENARFIRDVAVWKSVYFTRTVEFRSMRARSIAKLYLVPQGSLEINIGSHVKLAIVSRLQKGDIDVALFDSALKEVSDLVRFTLWVEFDRQVLKKKKTKTPYPLSSLIRQAHSRTSSFSSQNSSQHVLVPSVHESAGGLVEVQGAL